MFLTNNLQNDFVPTAGVVETRESSSSSSLLSLCCSLSSVSTTNKTFLHSMIFESQGDDVRLSERIGLSTARHGYKMHLKVVNNNN